MNTRRKSAIICSLAAITMAASVSYQPHEKPNFVEADLLNVSPATTGNAMPLSYWADAQHIVCISQIQSSTGGIIARHRECEVYEVPTGRQWHLPALDATLTSSLYAAGSYWTFVGLSKDRQKLIINKGYYWYSARALPVNVSAAAMAPKWHSIPIDPGWRSFKGGIPLEVAVATPKSISTIDRFVVWPDERSISPDGRQVAWVTDNISPERFHAVRNFLRAHHILSDRPTSTLWISDANGKHVRSIVQFGKSQIFFCDLRWSPDAKHLSCIANLYVAGPNAAPRPLRLTVFDVDP